MESQPEPTLVKFIRYNQWAKQQLLIICMNLDEELLTANIQDTVGSILEAFSHLLRAKADFLRRIHRTSPQPGINGNLCGSIGRGIYGHNIARLPNQKRA